MSKIKYSDLPPNAKQAIDSIVENVKTIIYKDREKNNTIATFSQLSWLIWYNIGKNKNFNTILSYKEIIKALQEFNLLTPAIEQELFPLIFSSPTK